MIDQLEWTQIESEEVSLPEPETVYKNELPLTNILVSPDGATSCVREKGDGGMVGFTADCGNRLKPVRVAISDYCYGLAWLTSDELVVVVLHHVADAEAAMSIELHAAHGTAVATLLKTAEWTIQPSATDPTNRTVYFSARSSSRQSFGGRDGVWLLDVHGRRATCVANATPAGGTVAVPKGRCLYADGAVQTSATSTLVSAGIGQGRNAKVFGFLRDFAVSAAADAVYYRQMRANGPTAIGRMSIGELMKSWGAASRT